MLLDVFFFFLRIWWDSLCAILFYASFLFILDCFFYKSKYPWDTNSPLLIHLRSTIENKTNIIQQGAWNTKQLWLFSTENLYWKISTGHIWEAFWLNKQCPAFLWHWGRTFFVESIIEKIRNRIPHGNELNSAIPVTKRHFFCWCVLFSSLILF